MTWTRPKFEEQDGARHPATIERHKEASDNNVGAAAKLNRRDHKECKSLYI
jgi:hypothetical protein